MFFKYEKRIRMRSSPEKVFFLNVFIVVLTGTYVYVFACDVGLHIHTCTSTFRISTLSFI